MSDNKMQEVEVKLHTPDLELVRSELEKAGAELKAERVFERNLRYENAESDLSARGIVLRLRQDDKAKLTYKADARIEAGISRRFEAEVVVSDFEAMDVILRRLGFVEALVYEKYRTTYALGGAEIVLDELPYGYFTEIEADAETIERVIAELGLGGARRMRGSYVEIFEGLKLRLGVGMRDCSFAAFAGVDVEVGDLD